VSDILDVFIGYDAREDAAAEVCRASMTRRTSKPLHVQYLKEPALRHNGWYDRPWTVESGQKIDTRDGKPFSTAFSFTRFLVPAMMQHEGVALFCDCDFLFLADMAALFDKFDPRYAVQVVKHEHHPSETEKMNGVKQTVYWRKNWSSLVLWNCGHKANMRLTPDKVNHAPGQWLHSFGWLDDQDIGDLPPMWNYLSGVNDKLPNGILPYAVHFTLGGPWFGNEGMPYADLWTKELHSRREPGRPLPSEMVTEDAA
jgi:lipopolysaccharide biosynthesis glycosyltransferase